MKSFTVTKPFLHLQCGLGESPYWEENTNTLRFVDIVNRSIYRVNLTEGPSSLKKYQYETSISVTADIEGVSDRILVAGKFGVGIAGKTSNELRYIQPFWSDEEKVTKNKLMRANDGAVDSQGRFWASALCDPPEGPFKPEGVLFRLDLDGSFHRMIEGVTIPNGMSWTIDETTLYFTDSKEQCIYAYDFDPISGSISNKREFYRTVDSGIVPDGHVQDRDGNLWVALWGGWKVICLTPQAKVIAEITLPTRCITAVAFAGEDLYITSEADPETNKHPESGLYHGDVFRCHVGITGRRPNKARVPNC